MASHKDHDHEWFELNRYLPYTPEDSDMDRIFPEHPRDENGKEQKLSVKHWVAPEAHVYFKCTDPECDATKQVVIPQEDVDELREMLESGEMKPEHLSLLPLGELIPSLADHETPNSGSKAVARTRRGASVKSGVSK